MYYTSLYETVCKLNNAKMKGNSMSSFLPCDVICRSK